MGQAQRERRDAILDLLASKNFSKQEHICEAINDMGYQATQSSVSRDIKELGVVKLFGRYLPPDTLNTLSPEVDTSSMTVEALAAGPNLIVVHTPIGAANVIALEIEKRSIEGVVGTVAGDDTIFVAVENKQAQTKAMGIINNLSG